jgi:hypothetical protein
MTDENLKIITILVYLLLALAIGYLIYILVGIQSNNLSIDDSRAAVLPEEITLSNYSSNGVTVSFTTQSPSTATLRYGTQPNTFTTVVNDKQDRLQPSAKNIHYFQITNLLPDTQYYYQLSLDGNNYSSNNGVPYSFKTLAATNNLSAPNPVLVSLPKNVDGGLVYLKAQKKVSANLPAIFPLPASLVTNSTNITIDLGLLKNSDGTVFDTQDADFQIMVIDKNGVDKYQAIFTDLQTKILSNDFSKTNEVFAYNIEFPAVDRAYYQQAIVTPTPTQNTTAQSSSSSQNNNSQSSSLSQNNNSQSSSSQNNNSQSSSSQNNNSQSSSSSQNTTAQSSQSSPPPIQTLPPTSQFSSQTTLPSTSVDSYFYKIITFVLGAGMIYLGLNLRTSRQDFA